MTILNSATAELKKMKLEEGIIFRGFVSGCNNTTYATAWGLLLHQANKYLGHGNLLSNFTLPVNFGSMS